MKNYILHIGLPKTGTTALQAYYFSKLQLPSICYNPPSIIGPLVQALKLLDFGELKKKDVALLDETIKHQSKKIKQNNILISLEILSQRLLRFDYAERGRFLKAIFPNAAIVLVLRYQPVLLRSLYQQHVQQNYILTPEEVFVPYAKDSFRETNHWKASMQIDIKQWNYKETIRYFRAFFGRQFHVLFYENHMDNILDLGKRILDFSGIHAGNEAPDSRIPKANVAYSASTMNAILNIARRKSAFSTITGFDGQPMQDLMQQARHSRYIFNAPNLIEFINRIENQQFVSRIICTAHDRQLLRSILLKDKAHNQSNPQQYELPDIIKSYLERESKTLNSSLDEVVDRPSIPKQYL